MKLSELERGSSLWIKIETELKVRLSVLREKNDGALTPDETARVRGAISQIKEILGWSAINPKINDD